MKYPLRPLSPSAAVPSGLFAHNFDPRIRKSRLRSSIDFQPFFFHQLTNPFPSKPFVLSSIQIAGVSTPASLQKETNQRVGHWLSPGIAIPFPFRALSASTSHPHLGTVRSVLTTLR